MAWAFDDIPHLRHQVKEYSKEVTYSRILRWLTARNNTKLSVDLFNPPNEAVVNPWLVPTIRELETPCLVTFLPIESMPDRLIDRLKGELARVTALARVDDVVADGGGLVAGCDVVVDTGGDVVVDAISGADIVGGVVQPVDVVVVGGGGGVGNDIPASIVGEKLRDDRNDVPASIAGEN
ncbi:uncharacterized protein LOC132603499 isoform X2 [Lycium barbarum]|uniref:uncharacterized protein LOC132603499 isoform X2 n=1 Tax=Lycium barbarum TaxID=112863 RepID=UPI00293F214D|nr:uncharacterized protein LOC132603499 isoform X2 [Lycium barbarum]